MTSRKAALLNFIISGIFALAIIFVDYIFRNPENRQLIQYTLIAIWWIPFTTLIVAGIKKPKK